MGHGEIVASRVQTPREIPLRVLQAPLNDGRESALMMGHNGRHETTLEAQESDLIAGACTVLAVERDAFDTGRERGVSNPPRTTTGSAPVHETMVAAVFNSRKGYGGSDACMLYRIRHTANNVGEAIGAAARAFMAMTGGVHPETPTRGPRQSPFTWAPISQPRRTSWPRGAFSTSRRSRSHPISSSTTTTICSLAPPDRTTSMPTIRRGGTMKGGTMTIMSVHRITGRSLSVRWRPCHDSTGYARDTAVGGIDLRRDTGRYWSRTQR